MKSQIRFNAEADPSYAPYCLRCSTMARMRKIGDMIWRCASCGAEHDEHKNAITGQKVTDQGAST